MIYSGITKRSFNKQTSSLDINIFNNNKGLKKVKRLITVAQTGGGEASRSATAGCICTAVNQSTHAPNLNHHGNIIMEGFLCWAFYPGMKDVILKLTCWSL